jgi:uncharacterized protein (TIGR02996 family)
MLQDEALRLMIQERPDEIGPRLVYADWLEERGECNRAELIRLQCIGDDEDRTTALIRTHGAEWAGPIARAALTFAFRRGFVEEITIKSPDFLRLGPELFSFAPIRLVRLIGARFNLDKLIEFPLLARLEALHLTGCQLGDEGLEILVKCPYLAELRTLRLGQNAISDAGVEMLAGSANLPGLQNLVLWANLVGDVGAHALASTRHLGKLRTLDLSDNQIGEMGAEALSASQSFPRLQRLDISHQFKGWSGGQVPRGRPLPIQPRQQQLLTHHYGADVCVF